jgi:hypothetical protein
MKKWEKTFLGLLLCAALAMGLLPGMAIPAMADHPGGGENADDIRRHKIHPDRFQQREPDEVSGI